MQNIQIIDVGSSTVKSYFSENDKISLNTQNSFQFKKHLNAENELAEDVILELISYIKNLKDSSNLETKIIATSLFRQLPQKQKQSIIDKCFRDTGCFFNIISQETESRYLDQALSLKCANEDSVLLINIGGGSTELIFKNPSTIDVKVNIELGVGGIIENFSNINDEISSTPLYEVIDYIKTKLPDLDNTANYAIYSGGELNYMQLARYKLSKNLNFSDTDHPSEISYTDFSIKNQDIFGKIKLSSLEELMPHDPKWMHGARACSAIAQAICDKYSVSKIVPSDSNTVHGLIRQQFATATLSGSYRKHLNYILEVKKHIEASNVKVLSPVFTNPKNPGETFVIFQDEEGLTPLELERKHLSAIDRSEILVVCCPDGYVGASALIEIGYAQAKNKLILFTERPDEFMLNTLPHEMLNFKKQPS